MRIAVVSLALVVAATACHRASRTQETQPQAAGATVTEPVASNTALPSTALDAAVAAVPGFEMSEYEYEGMHRGVAVYCIHGWANGRFYEIETTADGRVVEIEQDSDDDDDEGEDDDDEGEDDDK